MENPFSKIMGAFRSGLWKKSGNSILGVDVSSSAIKLVQVRREGSKAVLETYGEIALGPYGGLAAGQAVSLSPAKLAEALADLLKGANATATQAVLSIPLRSSLIVLIELPALDDKQVNEMVPLEARKYIPVPISEVALDWWVIPKPERLVRQEVELGTRGKEPEKVEVLIVAIHNSAVAASRKLSEDAGLASGTFEIETFSAIRALFGHDVSPTMIVDFGASSTKVTIVDYGVVRVSHVVNRGAQDITLALAHALEVPFEKAESLKRASGLVGQVGEKSVSLIAGPVLDYIFFEAASLMTHYQKKYARAISKTVLIGGGALLKGIKEMAAKSFQVEVQLGDPFLRVEAPALLEQVLANSGPEFAVAVGLALRGLQDAS